MVVAMQEQIQLPEDRIDALKGNCVFNYSPEVSPDYYGWIFPKGDHVSVGVGTRLENKGRLAEYLDRMKEINAEVLQGGRIVGRNGAMIPSGQYKEHGRHRILLTGDAAGMVLPACGEGIFYAMRSGEIAGQVIAKLGSSRPDIVVARYTDLVNAEFSKIFRYFDKVERAVYDSAVNREVFVRLASDRFMSRKVLSAFSTKTPKSTPIFRKLLVSLKLIGIRLKVAMMPRERLGAGELDK
jgi:geranylgeranyl reductase